MRIKVVQGKGRKDRYTILSQSVLMDLRTYYVECQPVEYLFNGQGKGRRYSQRSIQKVVHDAILRAGLANKDYAVHTIRHSFATHLVDNELSFHPHIHSIACGGGITGNNSWKQATKNDWQFLFPVKAMSKVYRGKFMEGLKELLDSGAVVPPTGTDVRSLINILYKKDWVVYAKASFGGPQAVIEYLGRYTHKVAISNHRISGIDEQDDTVNFNYKDYSDGGEQKQMSLSGQEFIRRFEQHILPKGLHPRSGHTAISATGTGTSVLKKY